MAIRYVLDGPAGSGKTTLIFGRSHEDPQSTHYECLVGKGYKGLTESVMEVWNDMVRKGRPPYEYFNNALQLIIEREVEKYYSVKGDNTCFFDRGLPHHEIFDNRHGAKLPNNFGQLCNDLRYSDPIFLLEPIPMLDLSKPRKSDPNRLRIFSLEHRRWAYETTKKLYQKRGYEIVVLPVFSDDFGENHRQRMKLIFKTIGA